METKQFIKLLTEMSMVKNVAIELRDKIGKIMSESENKVAEIVRNFHTCEEVDNYVFGLELPAGGEFYFNSSRNEFITTIWLDKDNHVVLESEDGDLFLFSTMNFESVITFMEMLDDVVYDNLTENVK